MPDRPQPHRPVRQFMSAAAAATIAALSFWLSFAALTELATMHGIPAPRAYAVPLIVDGLVVVSTVAAATMIRHRWYAWTLLVAATAASVAGNAIHAHLLDAGPVGIGIAVVPPIVNLAAIHLTIYLVRQDEGAPTRSDTAATGIRDTATDARDTATPVRDNVDQDVRDTATPRHSRPLRVAAATPQTLEFTATPRTATRRPATRKPVERDTTPAAATNETAERDTTPAAATNETEEQKAARARDMVARRRMSYRATAAELGVSKDKVARWVRDAAEPMKEGEPVAV